MWPLAKNEIELAIEVGVEEGGAPAHAGERGAGNAGGRAGVLEVAAVEVVIQRVAIVRERGEHEVHPRVAVVVAGVGAHARLGAGVAVHARRRRSVRRSRSGRSRGCGTGSSGWSRSPRTDRRARRRHSRSPRRRIRRRAVRSERPCASVASTNWPLPRFSKNRSGSPGSPAGPTMMCGPLRQTSDRCACDEESQVVST